MKATVYSQKGEKKGEITLPEAVFGVKWNADLVHQVTTSQQSNARVAVADTKGRGEVRGGGRKPWRQKGTGRARHGSRRSPIWKGGGVTHGPMSEKNYTKKINKKMRTKALHTVLSRKLKDNEVLFVDGVSFTAPKTREAKALLVGLSGIKGFEGLATKKRNTALFVYPTAAADKGKGGTAQTQTDEYVRVKKSFHNFGNVEVEEVRNLNPVDLLTYKYVVITDPEKSIKTLEARVA